MTSSERGCCWGGVGTLARAGAPVRPQAQARGGCQGFGIAFNLLDQSAHISLPEGPPVLCPEDSPGSPRAFRHISTRHAARPARSRGHWEPLPCLCGSACPGGGVLGPAGPQALTLVLLTSGHSLSALSPAHGPPRETHSPSPTLHCSSAPSSSAPLC